MIRPLAHDADLAACVPSSERALAVRLLTSEGLAFEPGPLAPPSRPDTLGLLVVDGLARKTVTHAGKGLTELLVPGDVLLPWAPDLEVAEQEVIAVEELRMAVLDRRFLQAAARWPALMVEVLKRLNAQEHRVAMTGAICQLPRVEDRILELLRHFGDRVGKVGPEGLRVPLPLTHRALGELVGARRPTVSIALSNLAEGGVLRRLDDGTWLLVRQRDGAAATIRSTTSDRSSVQISSSTSAAPILPSERTGSESQATSPRQ